MYSGLSMPKVHHADRMGPVIPKIKLWQTITILNWKTSKLRLFVQPVARKKI